jgi:RNA polymerase sigma factor (sigma-70 family)
MAKGQLNHVLRHVRNLAGIGGPGELSDAELLKRFRKNQDEAAFAALFHRHSSMVLGVCRRVLHHVQDAEDACQAAFLVFARKAGSIRKGEALGSWLHGVALRVSAKLKSDRARRGARARTAQEARQKEAAVPLGWEEMQAILDEELARLPEHYRAALVLCYLEGQSRDQAAGQLRWSEGTLRGRLERGRELLRKRLARRGVKLSAALLTGALSECGLSAAAAATSAVTTVKAAMLVAAGGSAGPRLVSAEVAALVEGVTRAMTTTRWTMATALLLVGLAVTGSLALCRPAPTGGDKGSEHQGKHAQVRADGSSDPLPPDAIARLGTLRLRHSDLILGIGFSADARTLVAADRKGVYVWDTATGEKLRQVVVPPAGTQYQSVSVSADGKTAAVATNEGAGGIVQLWDASNGKKLSEFAVGKFADVALSPNGKTLAVYDYDPKEDKSFRLLDAATGKQLFQLVGHEDPIHTFVFAADGKVLLSAGDDRSIRFWNVATGKQVRRLDSPEPVGQIALAPDGKTLASVGIRKFGNAQATLWRLGKEATLWDLATGKETYRLKVAAAESNVFALAFAPDSKALVTSDRQSTRCWEVATGKELLRRRLATHWAGALAFSPDGKTLATAGNCIHLWDVATGREKLPRNGHDGSVFAVAVSPDGKTFATGGEDGVICLWGPGSKCGTLKGHDWGIHSLAFTPNSRTLVSAGYDNTVRVWDVAQGKELRRFSGFSCALSPDGKVLATGEHRGDALCLQELATGKQLGQLCAPAVKRDPRGDRPDPIGFSADGRSLASWGAFTDRAIRVWDIKGRKILRTFDHHDIDCAVFSPDRRLMVIGSNRPRTVVFLDTATWKEVTRLRDLPIEFSSLALSPDNRVLATCDRVGGVVRLWEVATGQEFRTLDGHLGRVFHLAFSPDSTFLLSGSEDTTVLVWKLAGQTKPGAAPPTAPELEAFWKDLASPRAARAQAAVRALTAAADQAVPLLAKRVRLSSAESDRLARLISNLDSDTFTIREQASAELEKLGLAAESALRQALAGSLSLEARKRAAAVLETLEKVHRPERFRAVRAIQVLELIGTPEARRVLAVLARGQPRAQLTEQARAALGRLDAMREKSTTH